MTKYFNVCHLATGDLLRAEVGRGTQLGKEIKRVIDAGKLVSQGTLVLQILRKNLVFEKFPQGNHSAYTG